MSNSRLYGKMLVIESAAALATDLGLSLADMLVLIRLVSLYNRDCGYAWPGKKKLAAELGITVRQVNRSINRLVAAKVLAVTRGGGKHSQTNRYVPAPAISTTPFEDAAAKRERVTKQSSVQELRTRTTDDRAVPTDDRAVTPQMTAPSSKPSYSSSYKNPSDLPSAQCSKHCADTVISSQTDGEFLRRVERLLPSYQNGNLYNGKAVTVRRFFERCCEIFDGHDVDDPLAQLGKPARWQTPADPRTEREMVMTTLNAATLIGWVRVELGAEVYPEPAKTQPPGWYHIRLRAPNLKRLRPTPPLPA